MGVSVAVVEEIVVGVVGVEILGEVIGGNLREIVRTLGEEGRRIRGATPGATPAMRTTASVAVAWAISLLAAPRRCLLRSRTGSRRRVATNVPCGFALTHLLHRVAHAHHLLVIRLLVTSLLPPILDRLRLLHRPVVILRRFTRFGSRFAEEAYHAALDGDDDFEHVCDEECEGTHLDVIFEKCL